MNKIILAKNRKVEFPRRVKLTEPDTLNNYTYDLEFDPGLVTEAGTNLDANLVNLLQKNTFIDLKCNHITPISINTNLEVEIDGLNEFTVFQGLKLILVLEETSNFNLPIQLKILDNSEEVGIYPVKIYNEGTLKTVDNLAKGVYQLIYINDSFILISAGSSAGSAKALTTKNSLYSGTFNLETPRQGMIYNIGSLNMQNYGMTGIEIRRTMNGALGPKLLDLCIPTILFKNGYEAILKDPNSTYATCTIKITIDGGANLQVISAFEFQGIQAAVTSIYQVI